MTECQKVDPVRFVLLIVMCAVCVVEGCHKLVHMQGSDSDSGSENSQASTGKSRGNRVEVE